MLWLGKSLSKEDREKLKQRCQWIKRTYEICRKANSTKDSACYNLELQLVTCYAQRCCEREYNRHLDCVRRLDKLGWVFGDPVCEKYLTDMQQCLRRYKLYPFAEHSDITKAPKGNIKPKVGYKA